MFYHPLAKPGQCTGKCCWRCHHLWKAYLAVWAQVHVLHCDALEPECGQIIMRHSLLTEWKPRTVNTANSFRMLRQLSAAVTHRTSLASASDATLCLHWEAVVNHPGVTESTSNLENPQQILGNLPIRWAFKHDPKQPDNLTTCPFLWPPQSLHTLHELNDSCQRDVDLRSDEWFSLAIHPNGDIG